jgi:hypothetical protein
VMYKPRGSIGESMLERANRRWRRLAEECSWSDDEVLAQHVLHSPEVIDPNECECVCKGKWPRTTCHHRVRLCDACVRFATQRDGDPNSIRAVPHGDGRSGREMPKHLSVATR